MKKISRIFLCAAAGLLTTFSVSAFTLVSPQVGEVTKVKSLGTISLKWDNTVDAFPDKQVILYDSNNQQVAVGTGDYDWDVADGYLVTFNPTISTPGTYTAVVPANMAEDNTNPEYRLTYEIVAGAGQAAVPTAITPASGSEIVQNVENDVQFQDIHFEFGNAVSLTINKNNISFTDQSGAPVAYEITGFYEAGNPMLSMVDCPLVIFNFNEDGDMASGTYTLTLKPGTFTAQDGSVNEETIECVYKYTKTKPDVDQTPLEINYAFMGGAVLESHDAATGVYTYKWVGGDDIEQVVPDMPVAEFIGTNDVAAGETATGFMININHGEKSGYVTYEFIDLNKDEILRSSQCVKQKDNTFFIAWPVTTTLYEGTTYALEIHAYNNVQEKVEFGTGARLTFKGTTEPYKYSSAEFVTVVPTSESTLNSLNENKITVLYSQPVKATAQVSLGSGVGSPAECVSANEKEYDNVWYVYIPDYIMKGYPDANMSIVAYGEDGYIVEGNNGSIEENSNCDFSYYLTLCQPRVLLTQTNSHVAEINTFNAYASDGKCINPAWAANPYVINEKGETVAELNNQYTENEWGDKEAYKTTIWSAGDEWTREPLEIEFQMIPKITKKGKYTLVLPATTFAFGTQFDSAISVDQSYDFYVVDFYPVTYSVDNSTIDLSPVEETKTVNLSVKANENWKLETLTLNGKDVTADVKDGSYQSEPATGAMNFAATFAYDGIVLTPSGVDDVVSDLELRGWSEGGKLYVAGLKENQVVNVYTAGGSLMSTATVAEGIDKIEFDLAQGVYIITVTEGAQTVALKLMNK